MDKITIKWLSLKNYRNLEETKIILNENINIFYGDNAQGKTNILESVYVCATGRSHRTHIDNELIAFKKKEAHIQICLCKDKTTEKIDVHLKRDGKKGMAVNNIPIKKIGDIFGVVHVVIFSPEDLSLVNMGPSNRRRFLDMELCQLSRIYFYNLQQYYKILKQRNNLLKTLKNNIKKKDTLFVWDEQLIQMGVNIINARSEFVKKISSIASDIHKRITGDKEELFIQYKPNVSTKDFYNRLNRNAEHDIFMGSTSVGPHKDDLIFFINDSDVKNYGSRGQQRTASLSVKLAEVEIIKEEKSKTPVLLLDDVLSELDETRQNFLIENIKDIQTVITGTGIEDALKRLMEDANVYMVDNGTVTIKDN